jgi:hypothetical protein
MKNKNERIKYFSFLYDSNLYSTGKTRPFSCIILFIDFLFLLQYTFTLLKLLYKGVFISVKCLIF